MILTQYLCFFCTAKMENLVHYINPAHIFSLMSTLNEQRVSGHLCDVTLIVADQKFHAHRSVLAASSEYFQALFTRTHSDVQAVVHLDFCEANVFENVLNYIYSSSLFVSKESLAAIQELGYSLGISFLTTIMTKKPPVSYSVSRKTLFIEDKDSVVDQNTVKPDESFPHVKVGHFLGKYQTNQTPSYESQAEESGQASSRTCQTPEGDQPRETIGNTEPLYCKSVTDLNERGSGSNFSHSASESQAQRSRSPLHEKPQITSCQGQHPSKTPDQIGRSTSLMKTLSCRSLQLNSPVSGYSPVMDMEKGADRGSSVLKLTQGRSFNMEPDNVQAHKSEAIPTLIFPSQCSSTFSELDVDKMIVHVKTEPIGSFAVPSDIVQVTVGEDLPVNANNFSPDNNGSDPKGFLTDCVEYKKRKAKLNNKRGLLKKSQRNKDEKFSSEGQRLSTAFTSNCDGLKKHQQSTAFKCKNCMKIFRSSAALHRHVNMFHNLEKPYACDICLKRFHTKFKVWTHCQTQHGIMQISSSLFSSCIAPEDRPCRKPAGMVQEQEFNTNLLVKPSGSKLASLQSPEGHKWSSRTWSKCHPCVRCGKTFRFLCQLRQHLSLHSERRNICIVQNKEKRPPKKDRDLKFQKSYSETYRCRLCSEKLTSFYEHREHEQGCLYRTVCRFCGLKFSSSCVEKEHEIHCEYKKLTCLVCMRTFKSSFSIWRHQVEVHKQNPVNQKELSCFQEHSTNAVGDKIVRESSRNERDSFAPVVSESSEKLEGQKVLLCQEQVKVKEEQCEEAVDKRMPPDNVRIAESTLWSCEKCGKVFSAIRELEHHQELLCYVKPFICHICHKSFRTKFRLWSHIQSHTSNPDASRLGGKGQQPSSLSPSLLLLAAKVEDVPVAVPKSTERDCRAAEPPCRTQQANARLSPGAPALSAHAFHSQYVCKSCCRTFKSAFSLWSHEQSRSCC
ncbi:zinc finger and BTB domain-containing protein 21-like isoform X1 [Arapaima gigas]